MMWSNCEHADRHWLSFSWSNERRSVILFNWTIFSSKNIVLNFSRCFCGIEFIILVVRVINGGGCLASNLFGGIYAKDKLSAYIFHTRSSSCRGVNLCSLCHPISAISLLKSPHSIYMWVGFASICVLMVCCMIGISLKSSL